MTTQYTYTNNACFIDKHAAGNKRNTLDVGFYTVKQDPMSKEFFLEKESPVVMPDKLYNNIEAKSKRVLDTFSKRDVNTGVLMFGLKGTGKTVLAKKICIDSGLPVLLLTTPYHGEEFSKFISSIDQPCVIFVDEFEKVYNSEQSDSEYPDMKMQEMLLSLLDGIFSSKKLWLLTANNENAISSFLFNRPGRIFYRFAFSGLDEAFIRDYCKDNLNDFGDGKEKNINDVVLLSKMHSDSEFTIDILMSLVEEMNRYEESAKEASEYLNILLSTDLSYDLTITKNGEKIQCSQKYIIGSPMSNADCEFSVENYEYYVRYLPDELVEMNEDCSKIVFKGERVDYGHREDDQEQDEAQFLVEFVLRRSKKVSSRYNTLKEMMNLRR